MRYASEPVVFGNMRNIFLPSLVEADVSKCDKFRNTFLTALSFSSAIIALFGKAPWFATVGLAVVFAIGIGVVWSKHESHRRYYESLRFGHVNMTVIARNFPFTCGITSLLLVAFGVVTSDTFSPLGLDRLWATR